MGDVDVEVVTIRGVRAPGLARWLAGIAPARARGSVTVALVPDQRIRALNRQFRHKDRPTDVLSFPAGERGRLGDIVIGVGVAKAQAAEAGHSRGLSFGSWRYMACCTSLAMITSATPAGWPASKPGCAHAEGFRPA
jgi:hypothetical protein